LATELCSDYGCNEAGIICLAPSSGDDQFGSVWPRVRVEVVDDGDQPLPRGHAGRIRVKTECMVDGYLDNPEATARMFRDGWFYPGDLGVLDGPRRLHVLGRGDELLNIGGQKISPSFMEDLILGLAKISDVGICSIQNADGIEELCVAVSGARGNDQELLDRITYAFRAFQFGKFYVTKLDRIPRNANGKIQRNALKDAAAALIRRR
jgi:acyl-CoA synthetase (AMP-forming)/AMP-acid ligase II